MNKKYKSCYVNQLGGNINTTDKNTEPLLDSNTDSTDINVL